MVNTSEFEATHSKVKQIFASNMLLQEDSEIYGKTLLERLNQLNARSLDTGVISS